MNKQAAEGIRILRALADELESEARELRDLVQELLNSMDDGIPRSGWPDAYRDLIERVEQRFGVKHPE